MDMKYMSFTASADRKKRGMLLLYLALTAGIAAGAVWAVEKPDAASPLFHQFFDTMHSGATVSGAFCGTFISLALFILAAFLFGTAAVGQPFGVLLLIYRGFGIGLSVALMYIRMGISAFPVLVLSVFPKAVAVSVVSVLAVRELMRSSNAVFRYLVNEGEHYGEYRGIRIYCIRFAVLLIISFIISTADSFWNYILSGVV